MPLDSTTNGRADKEANGNDTETLAESCSNLVPRIFAQKDDNGGRETNKGAREETVKGHEDDDA